MYGTQASLRFRGLFFLLGMYERRLFDLLLVHRTNCGSISQIQGVHKSDLCTRWVW